MDGLFVWKSRLRVIPVDQNLLLFGIGHQGQASNRTFRSGNDGFEERCIVIQHALNRRALEEIGVVLDLNLQLISNLPESKAEIEFTDWVIKLEIAGPEIFNRGRLTVP